MTTAQEAADRLAAMFAGIRYMELAERARAGREHAEQHGFPTAVWDDLIAYWAARAP